MAQVLRFPDTAAFREAKPIRRPAWAQPGDAIAVVELDPAAWRFPRFAVARLREFIDGLPHVARCPAGLLVTGVRRVPAGYEIDGEFYLEHEVDVLGTVRELWNEDPAENLEAIHWVIEIPNHPSTPSAPLLWLNLKN